MKKICGAVLVECWSSDGKPRERDVRCTMPPDHAGRHGWELDKGDAATRLHVDATLVAANRMAELQAENAALKRHYDAAAPEHNLLSLLDLYKEREDEAIADVARLNKYLATHDEEYKTMQDVLRAENEACKRLREENERLPSDSQYSLAVIANLRAALSRIVAAIPGQGPIPDAISGPWTDSIVAAVAQLAQRPARSAQEVAELDSLYAYARDRLDPNRDREPPVVCACSPYVEYDAATGRQKYRELAPGVHAAYCPLAGKPT
jgi:hypothetical protein